MLLGQRLVVPRLGDELGTQQWVVCSMLAARTWEYIPRISRHTA